MTAPRPIDEPTLMAYLDGELDETRRAEVDAAIAADATLAQQVQAQQALRARLQAAYAPVLDEPVPERLRAALRGDTPPKVVDLDAARASRQAAAATPAAPRRWHWPEWGAMAASLVVGLIGGTLLLGGTAEPLQLDAGGRLVAGGTLHRALTDQLASAPPPDAEVQIGVSFVADTGAYCRSFVVDRESPLAGVACRDAGDWRVQVVAPAAPQPGAGPYRMAAAALPPAVLAAIDRTIDGAPLDAAAERAARERGWQ